MGLGGFFVGNYRLGGWVCVNVVRGRVSGCSVGAARVGGFFFARDVGLRWLEGVWVLQKDNYAREYTSSHQGLSVDID